MENDNTGHDSLSRQEPLAALYLFVIQQAKAGDDQTTISQKLTEIGIDAADAMQIVDAILDATSEDDVTPESLLLAVVGGGLAALLGGYSWGVIAVWLKAEMGYMAWGIGAMCALGVGLFTKGKTGLPFQAIAAISSVVGIAIGKYFLVFYYLKELITKEYGAAAAARIPMFSDKLIDFIVKNSGSILNRYDILWIILAVLTAWQIPRRDD